MRKRTEEVYLALKSELEGRRQAGALLPPERALCARFGQGRSAVRSALRRLEAEGLIRDASEAGAVRCQRRAVAPLASLGKVYVFQTSDEEFRTSAECVEALAGVCRGVMASGGEVVPVFSGFPEVVERLCADYAPQECSGVVSIEMTGAWLERLQTRGIPAVVANYEWNPGPAATRMDFRLVGRMGAQELLRRGYRRLAVIGRGDDGFGTAAYSNEEIVAGVRGALAEERIWFEDRLFVPDVYYTKDIGKRQEVMRQLRTLLEAPDRPDAFLVFRSVRVGKLAQLVQELGLSIPEELGILVYDLPGWCDAHDLDCSLLTEPVGQMGEAAVEMLKEWNATGTRPADRVFLPEFQPHATLRPVPRI